MRLSEAWKQINEAQEAPIQEPQEQIINVQCTQKEIALIRSLVQTAISEMTSDPDSGMKGIPPDISNLIKKLDTIGK